MSWHNGKVYCAGLTNLSSQGVTLGSSQKPNAPKSMWVYILASKRNGTLYTGVTNNLVRRTYEHREHLVPGFTKRYDVTRLMHFEAFEDPENAIKRQKNIKGWPRRWKIALIDAENPLWVDLWEEIVS